jgi:hypothetical protein
MGWVRHVGLAGHKTATHHRKPGAQAISGVTGLTIHDIVISP